MKASMTSRGMLLVAMVVLFLYAAPTSRAAIIASQTDDSASASLNSGDGLFAQDYLYYLGTGSGFTGTLQDLKLRFDSKGNSWRASLYCRTASDYASAPCDSVFGGTSGIDSPSGTFNSASAGVSDYTATWSGTNIFEASKHYFFRLLFNTDSGMFDPVPVLLGSTTPSSYSGACDPLQSTAGFCDILPDIYFVLNTVTVIPTPMLVAVSIASDNASTILAKTGDTVTITFTSSVELGAASSTIAGKTAVIATTSPTVYTASYQLAADDTEGSAAFTLSYSNLSGGAGFITSTTTDSSAVVFDKTAPALAEGAAIAASTDTTPDYTFTSDTAGALAFGGACSAATSTVGTGTTTLTFVALAVGSYSSCSLSVTDAAGNVGTLGVSPFTIEAVPEPAPAPAPAPSGGGGGGGVISGPLSVGYQTPYTPPPAPTPPPAATPEPQPVQVTVGASTGGIDTVAPTPASPTQNSGTDVREISNIQTSAAPAPAAPSVRAPLAVVTPWDTPAGKQINLAAAAANSGFQLPNWILILALLALAAFIGFLFLSRRT